MRALYSQGDMRTRVQAAPARGVTALATNAAARRATQVVNRMEEAEELEEANLTQSQRLYGDYVAHNEDAVDDDPSPVYSAYLDELGTSGVVTMVGLTPSEFDILWSVVEGDLVFRWTHGRGRRSSVAPKDAFFMTLCVMKHCVSR